jgi:hypothetical protein
MDMLSSSKITRERGSLVHVVPACAGSGEGSNHFGSYVRSLSLHFGKRLFPGLELMNSKKKIDVSWRGAVENTIFFGCF